MNTVWFNSRKRGVEVLSKIRRPMMKSPCRVTQRAGLAGDKVFQLPRRGVQVLEYGDMTRIGAGPESERHHYGIAGS